MTPDRYNALVQRLEHDARANPRALRRRVLGLVALGYLYIAGILVALVAAVAGIIWFAAATHAGGLVAKIVIALAVFGWLVLRSLWVRVDPPAGRRLAPGAAPALDRRVEEIRAALDAPRASEVLLTTDFNASVTQVPRLGIFGWPRTYLTLGLPLLYALAPHQLDAVLAHEFAHLSGAHPKRGLWVYRMGHTWRQLLDSISRHPAGKLILSRFLDWYAPRLQAYGFVMSRADEYEADADAAAVCGATAMAEALVALEVRGRTLSEHGWPEIWRQARSSPFPPEQSWSSLASLVRADPPAGRRDEWLGRALRRQALDDDTHPALTDRLTALGVLERPDATDPSRASHLLPSVQASAAHHYLGGVADELLTGLDEEWRTEVAESWSDRHETLNELRARADVLLAAEGERTLDANELWELASALAELESPEAALPWLRRAAAAMPDTAAPHFLLGRTLLDMGDAGGIAPLRHAMTLDADLTGHALELMRRHHADASDRAGVAAIEAEQFAHGALLREAAEERDDVTRKDPLDPPALAEDARRSIALAAAAHGFVEGIWVARKRTRLMTERPMWIVALQPRGWRVRGRPKPQRLAQEMLDRLHPLLGGDALVITLDGNLGWLRKKMEALPGARLELPEMAAR